MKIPVSVKITLWVNRMVGCLLLALIPAMPRLLDWYQDLRPLGLHGAAAIMIGFYCCVPVVLVALWNMDRILRSILQNQIFVRPVVRCIRRVRWCCLGVCLICLPAAVFYPPLVFMVVIMVFLALTVSVVAAVMDVAVTLREENDLTI